MSGYMDYPWLCHSVQHSIFQLVFKVSTPKIPMCEIFCLSNSNNGLDLDSILTLLAWTFESFYQFNECFEVLTFEFENYSLYINIRVLLK